VIGAPGKLASQRILGDLAARTTNGG
jgi:hypothetical protein